MGPIRISFHLDPQTADLRFQGRISMISLTFSYVCTGTISPL